jgi:small-conductance mechanosensitive channel
VHLCLLQLVAFKQFYDEAMTKLEAAVLAEATQDEAHIKAQQEQISSYRQQLAAVQQQADVYRKENQALKNQASSYEQVRSWVWLRLLLG